MEEILAKLLVSDNAVISQGTEELKEAFKTPGVIPALCNVMGSSQSSQIRQSAAVLLRKKLTRSKHWTKIPASIRNEIKSGILQALVNEPEKLVKNAIAHFIALIVKHEFPNQSWPEVLQFIQTLNSSEILVEKELGMYTLSVITESSHDQFGPHTNYLAVLFVNTLDSVNDPASPLAYYTLLTMLHFVPMTPNDQTLMNAYHKSIPRIIDIVKVMAQTNESNTCEVMEIFEDLIELSPAAIVPHIKQVVTMCLEFSAAATLGDELRVKALNLIGMLIRSKKKILIKNNFLEPILNIIFNLMSLPPPVGETEEYFTDTVDNRTPANVATQILDMLALHLPPDKLVPLMLPYIEPGLQGNNPMEKKSAYLAMAVIAEGCTEYIRNKYLETFVQCICEGIQEVDQVVRNAALFALGQFSEHLQPDISSYATQVLPVLFEYLNHLCLGLKSGCTEVPGSDRVFYALEMFCENLDDKLIPYLPMLFDRLIASLDPSFPVPIRELAISSIGATANSANKELIPYFPRIIESLKCYLTQEELDETLCLKTQSLDTLGHCIRAVGRETFQPLAKETIELAMMTLKNTVDPDIRKATFGLISAISSVVNEEMAPLLPVIVDVMLKSVKSEKGLVPQYKNDDPCLSVYDDLEDSNEEEDIENTSGEGDDDSIAGYMVANPFVEEKEEACVALKEIAKSTGQAFLPYLQPCFEDVFELLSYPQDDIRIAAIYSLTQFCINFAAIETDEGRTALLQALEMFVPKCALMVRTDDERSVASVALDAYADLLKDVKAPVIAGAGHKEAIFNCIKDVMDHKTQCQDVEDPDDADDQEAEQDEILIESAGNVVPKLGLVMATDEFVQYFKVLLPIFVKKSKKHNTLAQRSFSIGIISESIEALGPCIGEFVAPLYALLTQSSKDEHSDVRHNSIFGLGELVLHGKELLVPYFPEILQLLSTSVSKETHPGTLDNICGALSKLIITNVAGVPMEQVFPVFVNHLPLREDFAENKAVFMSLIHLYGLGHPMLIQHLEPLVHVGLVVFHEKQGEPETLEVVGNFLKLAQRDFSEVFGKAVASLPIEVNASIQPLFTG